MNIELDKQLGYDMARRNGVDMLHKTLTRSAGKELSESIANDLTTMLNQSVKAVIDDPRKITATASLAQLIGYLGELARVTGSLAEGWGFEMIERPGSLDPELTIKRLKA